MRDSFTIQRATAEDLPKVYNLLKRLASHHNMMDKFSISEQKFVEDRDHYSCIIAKENLNIIGIATFFYSYHTWVGRSIYLDDLFVVEKFRRQGVGSKLFERVITIARQESCARIRWQVAKWNTEAISFYSRYGAQIDEVERSLNLEYGAIMNWKH